MYVLKYRWACPDEITEYSYEESPIKVNKGIAVVRTVTAKDYMLGVGYELLGEIDNEGQLQQLFGDHCQVPQGGKDEGIGTAVESTLKTVPLGTIVGDEISDKKPDSQYWWQKEPVI